MINIKLEAAKRAAEIIQGIYEDYNFDDVEIDDNLILQRELQKYYYKSYNSLFSETHSNYKKMLFILKMMGELHGVACKNLNRKFIGIEKDETYFKIAQDRIAAI